LLIQSVKTLSQTSISESIKILSQCSRSESIS